MKIAANGIQINVQDRGQGEPSLVFLHYWGGSARTWEEVITQLADQHRSIALDHRGWGESDAPSDPDTRRAPPFRAGKDSADAAGVLCHAQ